MVSRYNPNDMKPLLLIALCLASSGVYGQATQTSEELIPQPRAQVELTIPKKIFGRREPIKFRVMLVNIDPRGFYISKEFYEHGGGIAGFDITVTQLSGKKGSEACVVGVADRFGIGADSRSPEQVLKEDFVPIRPGAFVGWSGEYQRCKVNSPGEYEISATYSTADMYQERVRTLIVNRQRVLDGTFKSKKIPFEVR